MFAYAVSILDRTIISLLVARSADLGVTDTQMGLIQGFALAFFFAVAGVPIGRLADLTSRKRLIAVGITFWSLATVFSGLAQRFLHLFVARMAVASRSGCQSRRILDAGRHVPKERLGVDGGLCLSSFLGAAIAFFFGGLLLQFLGERRLPCPFVGEGRNCRSPSSPPDCPDSSSPSCCCAY